MVIIKNLSLSFKEKVIFEDLYLNIEEGEITAVVGPSGIGKSSLFLCINQMIREENEYCLNGEILYKKDENYINLLEVKEHELPSLRKEVVYVSQHPDLLPMSVYENLAFFAKAHKISDYESKIKKVLKQVFLYKEIKDRLHMQASSLSGGQQQRLILARALLLEPKLLLLDEPTASLNEELSLKIEQMLKELGITVAIISHFKSQVQNLASSTYSLCNY